MDGDKEGLGTVLFCFKMAFIRARLHADGMIQKEEGTQGSGEKGLSFVFTNV